MPCGSRSPRRRRRECTRRGAARGRRSRRVCGRSDAPQRRTREIYMAHFAIIDVQRRRFRFAQKLSRAALGLAGAQAAPLHVWIDDWSLEGAAEAVFAAPWRLRAAQPGYELELTLQAQAPPVLNGEAGLSRKSGEPGDATYYYSIPRLSVY